ncbi:MBL fold metallo-hydrolase [Pseudoclavibacter sp. RFBA6]|uniref:MBL fold metallo-hydrolase n=1 Tax=Pseudoclavibacter sp. RFBA6 TaxID=2080573 RepID=UPI000CE7969A|nr:MBL fold metallo-hydrolase [Pseudoclavibacter sp. RFBA6]PPG40669.1 Zn-dependent hydrolase [Pseudoclavibacter sp. RFBA6]
MSAHGKVRIDRIVTRGTFSLDGGTWDVDNNVYLVGDDDDVVVIDPAHDAQAVRDAVGDRRVRRVLLTHGHDDHIAAAQEFATLVGAPIALHGGDRMLWDAVYPDAAPDIELTDDDRILIDEVDLQVLHTPGHSPGSVCFYAPALGTLFSGDTLFSGGPGATGRSYSDFGTIIASISDRLLTLPPETTVLTGHGDATSIGAEAPHLEEWIARGH